MATPCRHEVDDELGRERARRTRHLGAAGFGAEDLLVGTQRPRAGCVAIADGLAELGEVIEDRAAQMRSRDPEPPRVAGKRSSSVRWPSPSSVTSPVRSSSRATVVPSTGCACFDEPEPARELGREVDAHDRVRLASRPSTAAATVADVFTTTRSPARRWVGRSQNVACTTRSAPSETSSFTSSRPRPRTSAGSWASSEGSSGRLSEDSSDGHDVTSDSRYRPLGRSLSTRASR